MSRPPDDMPEPLLAAEATDFERRLLESARQDRPSAATSARMAKALGLAAGAAKAAATEAAAGKAAAAGAAGAGAGTAWPWISVGLVGLAVAGTVIATRTSSHESRTAPQAVTAPAPTASSPLEAPTDVSPPDRPKQAEAAADLGDQIALLDGARSAIEAGASRRALETLRRYEQRYPGGSFRPEATALKVEALVKLGRTTEARALAERFVTEHRGSLLARRVADLTGLTVQGK